MLNIDSNEIWQQVCPWIPISDKWRHLGMIKNQLLEDGVIKDENIKSRL
jgi:hypothetical protein